MFSCISLCVKFLQMRVPNNNLKNSKYFRKKCTIGLGVEMTMSENIFLLLPMDTKFNLFFFIYPNEYKKVFEKRCLEMAFRDS